MNHFSLFTIRQMQHLRISFARFNKNKRKFVTNTWLITGRQRLAQCSYSLPAQLETYIWYMMSLHSYCKSIITCPWHSYAQTLNIFRSHGHLVKNYYNLSSRNLATLIYLCSTVSVHVCLSIVRKAGDWKFTYMIIVKWTYIYFADRSYKIKIFQLISFLKQTEVMVQCWETF